MRRGGIDSVAFFACRAQQRVFLPRHNARPVPEIAAFEHEQRRHFFLREGRDEQQQRHALAAAGLHAELDVLEFHLDGGIAALEIMRFGRDDFRALFLAADQRVLEILAVGRVL